MDHQSKFFLALIWISWAAKFMLKRFRKYSCFIIAPLWKVRPTKRTWKGLQKYNFFILAFKWIVRRTPKFLLKFLRNHKTLIYWYLICNAVTGCYHLTYGIDLGVHKVTITVRRHITIPDFDERLYNEKQSHFAGPVKKVNENVKRFFMIERNSYFKDTVVWPAKFKLRKPWRFMFDNNIWNGQFSTEQVYPKRH